MFRCLYAYKYVCKRMCVYTHAFIMFVNAKFTALRCRPDAVALQQNFVATSLALGRLSFTVTRA